MTMALSGDELRAAGADNVAEPGRQHVFANGLAAHQMSLRDNTMSDGLDQW